MRKTTQPSLLKGIALWGAWACCALLPAISAADSHALGDPLALADAPKAMTTVLDVAGPEVTLGAGSRNGMILATEVTLLRQGEPIVHPLTGQVLGIPQEPVGVVHVYEVQERTARGRMVKSYSDPMVDDLAEYAQAVVLSPEPAVDEVVDEFAKRMRDLESSVQDYEKANDALTKSYPAFARRAWDEISAMRSYMVSLDERLVELEEQQSEDHSRLASVLTGEYRPEDLKEFTLRYTPDTQIKLQASGKTLLISVVNDSVRIEAPMAAADDMLDEASSVEGDEPSQFMATMGSWFDDFGSYWIWVAAAGLLIALLIMAILIIKRRYRDVMDGLEEFDDEYLDEDEQEDDEDEY